MSARVIETGQTRALELRVNELAGAASRLPAAGILELDRLVSRLAAHVRLGDPEYRSRQETGLAIARLTGRCTPR